MFFLQKVSQIDQWPNIYRGKSRTKRTRVFFILGMASADATATRTASVDSSISLYTQLEQLLADPLQKDSFRKYLCDSFSVEILEFWEETRLYANLQDARTRKAKLAYLFDQYISENSTTPINIDCEERRRLETLLTLEYPEKDALGTLSESLFNNIASSQFLNYKHVPRSVTRDDFASKRLVRKSVTLDSVHSSPPPSKMPVRKVFSSDDSNEEINKKETIWKKIKQRIVYSPPPMRSMTPPPSYLATRGGRNKEF